jgi:hypothetical protein
VKKEEQPREAAAAKGSTMKARRVKERRWRE